MNNGDKDKLLRVGELAKSVGKTVRALHLYEELGLLRPTERSAGGYRLYAAASVTRVNWIIKLQSMGFSLPEIQGFLRDWEEASSGPSGMRRVRDVFAAKLAETRQTIKQLQQLEQNLVDSVAYLETCGTCEPATHTQESCGCCDADHKTDSTPELVGGLALAHPHRATTIDVPVGNLTER
jgi:MerR family transcriptional regulator, copper efflux regulator